MIHVTAGAPRFVYFVVGDGKTRVGVAETPTLRLAALQACSPVPLHLVHYVPGDVGLERVLHRVLADRRLHGEWFEGEMDVEEAEYWILQARTLLRAAVPHPRVPKKRQDRDVSREYAEQEAANLLRWFETAGPEQRQFRAKAAMLSSEFHALSNETKARIEEASS